MTEAEPSLVVAAIRVLLLLAVSGGAAAAWVWWRRRSPSGRRHMQIQDRLFLNRGSSIVLLRVDDQRLVIGVTPEGTRLLRALPATQESAVPEAHAPEESQRFTRLLARAGGRK